MPYVQRDQGGKVIGRYANPQEYAQEWLDDGHPDLVPAPTVPQQVPIRKAKQLLIDRDKYDIVNNTIMAMTGKEGRKAQIEWLESGFVERYRPLTLQMFALIGVNTDAERDQWFIDGNAYP